MKKKAKTEKGEIRSQYDLSKVRPNPYAETIRLHGSNLVVIEPDLFEVFPDSDAVNDALRMIVRVSAKATKTKAMKLTKTQAHAKAS